MFLKEVLEGFLIFKSECLLFLLKLCKFYLNSLELLLFCNVQRSSAWVNLRAGLLLDGILVSSVPRATVSTLKPKNLKKPKNLN